MHTIENLRAERYDQVAPLIDFCKNGHLFEVQQWIAEGKPLNNPPTSRHGRNRPMSALEFAIDRGFHSLVQILLEGGALQEPTDYECPMNRAMKMRRVDIVRLLVEHGFDSTKVDMAEMFASWHPKIMELHIAGGADIRTGTPFAFAFVKRVRSALGVFRNCLTQSPDIMDQASAALRHHCVAGDLKWVSLMMWLGADPFQVGTALLADDDRLADHEMSACEWAAFYRNFKVFDLLAFRNLDLTPQARELLPLLVRYEGHTALRRLLSKGVSPNDSSKGGCTAICKAINDAECSATVWIGPRSRQREPRESEGATQIFAGIKILLEHGAKWIPEDKFEVARIRTCFLGLKKDYLCQFIAMMADFNACSKHHAEMLVRTPAIVKHLAYRKSTIQRAIARLT
ncbi:ankyrin repeat domain-containing protein [Anatilimnocola floriformis]|uniref:ankyrin repeat domain-containing protein n=1 Tax=Anatilimnocola floriformis TaxID=2948575 RepID=UPI0020C4882C|nr:ankyrin repeat domain-containing protein [Anatilimnocola floriformis]